MRLFKNTQEFYTSKEWADTREYLYNLRLNEKGELICSECNQPIVLKYDAILHHETELSMANVNNIEISMNPDNLRWVHHKCHNFIHQRFGYNQKKVYLITGAVCSGKTMYVNSIAMKNDIILDIDKIWECISNNEQYQKPNTLRQVVFAVRDTILDQIKVRNGDWSHAYVISTESKEMQLKRTADMLGAEIIYMDVDKETCLQRLRENPKGRDVSEYEKYIETYYEYLSE